MSNSINFDELAADLGYKTVKDMLTSLYKCTTLGGVAGYLGVSIEAVRCRMLALGIPRRGRGVKP